MDFSFSFPRCFLKDSARPAADFRSYNSDFCVSEDLGFIPFGEGEHIYVQIRKNGQNTHWVREQLAKRTGLKPMDIGYSGLKDRHAITSQWLSLYLPRSCSEPDPCFSDLDIEGVEILQAGRHPQKLRPGTHRANQFQICLRNLKPSDTIEEILQLAQKKGIANFFGEQRFGFEGGNLIRGWDLLQKRKLKHHPKKSIYLSALRSFLFNKVLSAHIDSSYEPSLEDTGPLWGRGRMTISEEQEEFEKNTLALWLPVCEALEYSGLKQERRQLYVLPKFFSWEWLGDSMLSLKFELPPGSYATSVLHEIADIKDVSDRS